MLANVGRLQPVGQDWMTAFVFCPSLIDVKAMEDRRSNVSSSYLACLKCVMLLVCKTLAQQSMARLREAHVDARNIQDDQPHARGILLCAL